jgi:hypothetical protein
MFAWSESLLTSCMAYQVMIDPKYAPLAEQYYDRNIEQFRLTLANLMYMERQTTIYAGLVLCSISVSRRALHLPF